MFGTAPPPTDPHDLVHFFREVCICSCRVCTRHTVRPVAPGKRPGDVMICICEFCPDNLCGAKQGV